MLPRDDDDEFEIILRQNQARALLLSESSGATLSSKKQPEDDAIDIASKKQPVDDGIELSGIEEAAAQKKKPRECPPARHHLAAAGRTKFVKLKDDEAKEPEEHDNLKQVESAVFQIASCWSRRLPTAVCV